MGLGVSAYRGITKIDAVFNEDGEPIDPITREEIQMDNHVRFFVHDVYPEMATDIESGKVYSFEEDFYFYAGCYGYFNEVREHLAELVGYPLGEMEMIKGLVLPSYRISAYRNNGAFAKFLQFSDCSGTIGTEACKKLSKDFTDYQHKVDEYIGRNSVGYPEIENPYSVHKRFKETYGNFRKAFDLAANNGAVQFG